MEEQLIELTEIQDRHSGYPISTPVYIVEQNKIKATGIVVKNLVHYGPPTCMISRVKTESGVIVIVREKLRFQHGCSVEFNIPGSEQRKANGTVIGFSEIPRKKDSFVYSIVCQIDGKEKIFHNVEPCHVKHLLEEEVESNAAEEAASVPREVVLEKENTDVSVMPSLQEGQVRNINQILPAVPIKKEAVEQRNVNDDESDSSSIIEIDEETAFRLTEQEEVLSHQDGSIHQVNGIEMNKLQKNDGDHSMKDCNSSQLKGEMANPESKDIISDVNEIQKQRSLGETLSEMKIKNEAHPTEGSFSESTRKSDNDVESNPVASTTPTISNATSRGAAIATDMTVKEEDTRKVTTQIEDISTKPHSIDPSTQKNVDEIKSGKGDPRMTKAFGVCIKDPSVPRIDALIQGGFEFLQYDPNKKVPMKSIVDKDGVTLYRRMKTLGVRLCLHKKKQNKGNIAKQNSSNKEDNKDAQTPHVQHSEGSQSNRINNQAPALEEKRYHKEQKYEGNSSTIESSKIDVCIHQSGGTLNTIADKKRKTDPDTNRDISIPQRKQTREESGKPSAPIYTKSELGKRKSSISTSSTSIVQRIPKKSKPSLTEFSKDTIKERTMSPTKEKSNSTIHFSHKTERNAPLTKEKSNSSIDSLHKTNKNAPLTKEKSNSSIDPLHKTERNSPLTKEKSNSSIDSLHKTERNAPLTKEKLNSSIDSLHKTKRNAPLTKEKSNSSMDSLHKTKRKPLLLSDLMQTMKAKQGEIEKPPPKKPTDVSIRSSSSMTSHAFSTADNPIDLTDDHSDDERLSPLRKIKRRKRSTEPSSLVGSMINTWKYSKPVPSHRTQKEFQGETYYWCSKCNRQKGMWALHHEEDHRTDNHQDRIEHWTVKPPKKGEPVVKNVRGTKFTYCNLCRNGKGQWTNLHLEGKHWKLVPPKNGEDTTKIIQGDKYHWCKHCLNGDGQWTKHKSSEHGSSNKHPSLGNVVVNPNPKCWREFRQFIDMGGNIFPEILDNKNLAPGSCHDQSITVCLHYHIKGQCFTKCRRAADHKTLPLVLANNLKSWCQEILNTNRNTSHGKQSLTSPAKMIPRGSPNRRNHELISLENSPLSKAIVAYKGTLTFDKIKKENGLRYLIGKNGSISRSLSQETGCSLYHFCGIGEGSCQVILAHRTENGLEEAAKVILRRLRNNISNSLLPSPRDIKIVPLTRHAENELHQNLVCHR